MHGQKPTLFIGKAVLLNKKGEEDKGEVRYTAVHLHFERNPIFGQAYTKSNFEAVIKAALIMKKVSERVIFEPPKGIDFRGGNGLPRRYEALELKELYRVQAALGFF